MTEGGLEYYEIPGRTVGSLIMFDVAEMTANCTETAGCQPGLNFDQFNTYPTNVSTGFWLEVNACNTPISLEIPVGSTLPIYTEVIRIRVGYNSCDTGKEVIIAFRLKLTAPTP